MTGASAGVRGKRGDAVVDGAMECWSYGIRELGSKGMMNAPLEAFWDAGAGPAQRPKTPLLHQSITPSSIPPPSSHAAGRTSALLLSIRIHLL